MLQAFADAGKAAKIDVDISADIERRALGEIHLPHRHGRLDRRSLRSPIGPIRADPELRGFFRALMEEAYAVGKAKGVALDADFIDGRMNFVTTRSSPA